MPKANEARETAVIGMKGLAGGKGNLVLKKQRRPYGRVQGDPLLGLSQLMRVARDRHRFDGRAQEEHRHRGENFKPLEGTPSWKRYWQR